MSSPGRDRLPSNALDKLMADYSGAGNHFSENCALAIERMQVSAGVHADFSRS
jgi:hypothetical protein